MKRYLPLLVLFLLSACAGNPPQWWNPSGAYSADPSHTAETTAETSTGSAPVAKDNPIPAEQDIDAVEESYEELDLSEKPAAAQTEEAPATKATTEPEVITQVEEHLPEDGSLPSPSVLD